LTDRNIAAKILLPHTLVNLTAIANLKWWISHASGDPIPAGLIRAGGEIVRLQYMSALIIT
jgi:hypothetical protein